MALTERTEQKLEILPNGVIQVLDITVIERDGVVIDRLNHRKVVEVEDDVTNESERIRAVAAAVWTPAVIAARRVERNIPAPPELP